jgi:phosphoglycerate dehydrogenase-like enzyme/predicted dehydrogenase
MRPPRVLVIGAGPAAVSMHLPELARLRDAGEIVLTQVCDIDCERAAAARRQFRFLEESGDGLGALQRPDIDAVYIFASAQLHFEYGLAALQNGKHLFVEKPIAPSYSQANALALEARARGLIAAAGHNRRFYKSLAAARARAGMAGWRSAEAIFHKPEFARRVPFGAASWLSANGIHALDALVFMMGELPEQVTALAGETGGAAPSVFSALMSWRNGAQAVFLCNNSAGARHEEYVFHGVAETVRITESGLTVERDNIASSTQQLQLGDGIAAEHAAFIEAIRTGVEPTHSIGAIAPSLLLAELIEQGFAGRVVLPITAAVSMPPKSERAASILVDRPSEMQEALGRLLPDYRLISRRDVETSSDSRPDIVAAILGRGSPPLDSDTLSKLPRLRIVGVIGLSFAHYDPTALLGRGITLVNASEAYAEGVAEFALALAILGRRRAFASHEVMRAGGWGIHAARRGLTDPLRRLFRRTRPVFAALGLETLLRSAASKMSVKQHILANGGGSRDLRGTVVGLIGWGANARAFAAHLLRAQARVLVYSEHAVEEDILAAGASSVSLNEALAADVVSLHRGLTPSTRHFLGAPELAKLRPGAVFINVARGALTDPDALLARLKQGDVFACLDSYDEEPLGASHPLRKLRNVFLTSHIAGGSPDMRAEAAEEVIGKITAHLEGNTVGSISAERLLTMT